MKWSPLLHTVAWVSGVAGALALLGAWLAGETGRVLGFTQAHLYADAQTLLLVSVAFGVGAIYHHRLEVRK